MGVVARHGGGYTARAMEKRPGAVIAVAVFLFAATGIAALVGWGVLFPNRLMDRLWEWNKAGAAAFRAAGRIAGVFLLVLAGGTLAAGAGLIRGKRWAWRFAVALFAVNGLGDLASVIVTGDWVRGASGVAVCSVFLYALARGSVRRYCGMGKMTGQCSK